MDESEEVYGGWYLKHFIWDLEDIERLGVSDEARSRIARCIRIYNESIVE